jgi:hypothetical protein
LPSFPKERELEADTEVEHYSEVWQARNRRVDILFVDNKDGA